MSAQSWKDEFYPVDAIQAVGSWQEAAEHSLRKWKGALGENLIKHGIVEVPIELNALTCSLCRKMDEYDASELAHGCERCVMYVVHGSHSCTNADDDEQESPLDAAITGDPEPLIELLEKAVEYAKDRGI